MRWDHCVRMSASYIEIDVLLTGLEPRKVSHNTLDIEMTWWQRLWFLLCRIWSGICALQEERQIRRPEFEPEELLDDHGATTACDEALLTPDNVLDVAGHGYRWQVHRRLRGGRA